MLMGFCALCWMLAASVRTAEAEPGDWNFPLSELFFFPPAELALEFEVQNGFLEVAEEALYLIPKSASFGEIIYLPLWELLVLDGDSSCIRLAENL